MRKIHLYGALKQEFGAAHSFAVETIAEAIQALRANFPAFAARLRPGFYRVVVGQSQKNGMELGESDLAGFRLGNQDLHIVPVVKGSKRGGLGKIIAGIALIGLSIVTGGAGGMLAGTLWGSTTGASLLGQIGVGVLMTGVASLLAPQVEDSGDKEKSYTSSGPVVTTREGGIIPIAYGKVICGGTMINGLLTTTVNGQKRLSLGEWLLAALRQ